MDTTHKLHTLCKEERLCGKRAISGLFDSGNTFFLSPYKVFWLEASVDSAPCPSRFTVSVPKRRFKKAVERNLMKRRIREAFRLNKKILNSVIAENRQIHLIAVFASDRLMPFSELEAAMKKILQRIARQCGESD